MLPEHEAFQILSPELSRDEILDISCETNAASSEQCDGRPSSSIN